MILLDDDLHNVQEAASWLANRVFKGIKGTKGTIFQEYIYIYVKKGAQIDHTYLEYKHENIWHFFYMVHVYNEPQWHISGKCLTPNSPIRNHLYPIYILPAIFVSCQSIAKVKAGVSAFHAPAGLNKAAVQKVAELIGLTGQSEADNAEPKASV